MPTRRRPAAPFAAALLALGVLAAAGCYRHVVEVRGGPSNVPVHEPNIGKDESIWSNPAPKQRPTASEIETARFPGQTP